MTSAAPTAVLTVNASIRINLTKTPGHGGDCKKRIIYNMIIIFTAVFKKRQRRLYAPQIGQLV